MVRHARDQVFDLIEKNGALSVHRLALLLALSPQAAHRHLRRLLQEGRIEKIGSPPKTRYRPASQITAGTITEKAQWISRILGDHPAVQLVSLFGSQARNEAGPKSDIDVLIWIAEGFHRQDIWNFWDRHSKHLSWAQQVSLVVKRLKPQIFIDTLLLDLPEEHICLFDRVNYFERIKHSVVEWRQKNGARQIQTFGNTHAWEYCADSNKKLTDLDFTLEIGNVA